MPVIRKLVAWGWLLLAAWGCGDRSLPPADRSALVTILGAKLIDGTGSDPIEDSVLVIEGTRIRHAGPRSHAPVPKGGQIIDGTGKTIIPGLVELHAHYFGDRPQVERSFRTQLAFGVTTSRSIGVDTEENLATLADARAGKIAAPRLYTAGLGFTHPRGHPIAQPIVRRPAAAEEARAGVAELAAQKVDFIKVWVDSKNGSLPKITPEVRAAIVEEARRRHIPVVAHIFDEADARQLIELGVTDFLHTVRDKEVDADFIELCRDRNVSFTPTLSIAEAAWYFAEYPKALDDPELRSAFAPATLADLLKPETREQMLAEPNLKSLKSEFERAKRFVKTMANAGVRIGVGSDSGAGNVATGWGTHHEMSLLVDAGLTPLQVITAATGRGAQLLSGAESEFGALQPGKIADLIVLEADPLADIANTRKIHRVMQTGKWLDELELDPTM